MGQRRVLLGQKPRLLGSPVGGCSGKNRRCLLQVRCSQVFSLCQPSAGVQHKHLDSRVCADSVKKRWEEAGRRVVPALLWIPRLDFSVPQLDVDAALTVIEAGRSNPLTFRAFRNVGPELFTKKTSLSGTKCPSR